MSNLRLGYACINTYLQKKNIISSRTARLKTIKTAGIDLLKELSSENVKDTMKILEWNLENKIYVFRISSEICPHAANPQVARPKGWPYKTTYDLKFLEPKFKEIGNFARKHGMRLTMHPGQTNNLGTPHDHVLESTQADLHMHTEILDMIDPGCEMGCFMIIHGGGAYGDKANTLIRWRKNFLQLPQRIQRRIVLENDDRTYTVDDLLPLCLDLNIPLLFDTFHYELNHTNESLRIQMVSIVRTWRKRKWRLKLHISEQDPHSNHKGSHSQLVEEIPKYVFQLAKQVPLDLMVEAKGKEKAVMHLREKYPKLG